MDSGYSLNEHLSALKADVKEWIETRIKLLQLHVFEKTAILGSFLIFGVIVINFLFFAFLFAFLALGVLLGKWINNLAGGFAIVSFLYLLILALMLIFRKAIFTGLQNLFLKELNPEPYDKSPVN
jgi:amino acid transporter